MLADLIKLKADQIKKATSREEKLRHLSAMADFIDALQFLTETSLMYGITNGTICDIAEQILELKRQTMMNPEEALSLAALAKAKERITAHELEWAAAGKEASGQHHEFGDVYLQFSHGSVTTDGDLLSKIFDNDAMKELHPDLATEFNGAVQINLAPASIKSNGPVLKTNFWLLIIQMALPVVLRSLPLKRRGWILVDRRKDDDSYGSCIGHFTAHKGSAASVCRERFHWPLFVLTFRMRYVNVCYMW